MAKGWKDSADTTLKKQIASSRPRSVRQGLRSRSLAATLYSYETPLGFCENRVNVLELYPTFSIETLTGIAIDSIISNKFVSLHPEFKLFLGKKWSEIGFRRVNKE